MEIIWILYTYFSTFQHMFRKLVTILHLIGLTLGIAYYSSKIGEEQHKIQHIAMCNSHGLGKIHTI